MKIYLSGPMSGIKDFNFQSFNRLETCIKNIDDTIEVVNPVKISEDVKKCLNSPTYNDYLKADLKKLLDCDCVVCLEDWENSNGARIEIQLAEDLKIKICFGFDDFLEWYQTQIKKNILTIDDDTKLYIIKNDKQEFISDFGWSVHKNKAKLFKRKSTAESFGKMLVINQKAKNKTDFKTLYLVEVELKEIGS